MWQRWTAYVAMLFIILRILILQLTNRNVQAFVVLERLRARSLPPSYLSISRSPSQSPFLWATRGNILNELARHEEADSSFAIAYHLAPKNLSIIKQYSSSLLSHSKYSEALPYLEYLTRVDSHNDCVWNNIANALNGLGSYDKALECIDHALALNKRSAHAICTKGEILMNMERYWEALYWVQKAIRRGHRHAYSTLARVWRGLGNDKMAQQAETKSW